MVEILYTDNPIVLINNTSTNIQIMKNQNNNIINNVPVAGTDLFADSENFFNELTDSEMVQIRGGAVNAGENVTPAHAGANLDIGSNISLLLCA